MNADEEGQPATLFGQGPEVLLVLPPSFTYREQAIGVVRTAPSVYDALVTLDGTRLVSAHRNAFRVLLTALSDLDAYNITLESREPWALDLFRRQADIFGPSFTNTRLIP